MICPHFGACGGCSRQDLSYDDQVRKKEHLVKDLLSHLPVATWSPIIRSPEIHFFRNKMEYSFGDKRDLEILSRPRGTKRQPSPVINENENTVHLGLHPKGRFALVAPTPDCQLLSLASQKIMKAVSAWANEYKVSIYVRKSGEGDLRHLVIREGKNTQERMVNLIMRSSTPHLDQLTERLKDFHEEITTLIYSFYDGLSDVASSDSRRVVWGAGVIHEVLGKVKFQVAPSSFMQTNTHAAEGMMALLRSWVEADSLHSQRPMLVDLYCGSGAIGLNMSDLFAQTIGIEINPESVRDAELTAKKNGIESVKFLEGRAEVAAQQLPLGDVAENATIIVDPPRAGLSPDVVKTVMSWRAPRIYYVSCNPKSLERDLRLLSERYSIVTVQPMDFFPHTDHIETAVRLKLR